jgi:hypothetical protein
MARYGHIALHGGNTDSGTLKLIARSTIWSMTNREKTMATYKLFVMCASHGHVERCAITDKPGFIEVMMFVLYCIVLLT